MKTILAVTLVLLIGTAAQARSPMGPMYLVEPMKCKGVQRSAKGYGALDMTFTSFKTTRRDGEQVPSLEVATNYSSNLYTSPLRLIGKQVTKLMGAYEETLDLKIVSSKVSRDGVRTDKLKGDLTMTGTVVGDQRYTLKCTATVVKETKRVDDFTSTRRR